MLVSRKTRPAVEYHYTSDCPYPYVYWRDATGPCWASTDDGCVVWVKNVRHIPEIRNGKEIRVRKKIMFEIGYRYAHGRAKYEFLDVAIHMSYGMTVEYWWEKTTRMEPGLILTFAILVIAKQFDLTKYRYNAHQYSLFREISKKFFNVETEWRKIRTYFNHDKVREMIQKKIEEVLKQKNIDVDKVFGLLSKAEQMALTHVDKMGNIGNPAATLAVADRYAGLIGMTGKKQLGNGQPNGQEPDQLPGADKTYDMINSSETIPPQGDV